MPDVDTVRGWHGATTVDRDGDKVGTLDTETVTEERQVTDEVRKEHIDLEDDRR